MMIQLYRRNCYINEKEIVGLPIKLYGKFYIKDKLGNRYEISEEDYYNLGGE